MFSLNGPRSEGYVQELFHEEAQQVCRRVISLHSPSFHLCGLRTSSWSPLWQVNRAEVTKLPFFLLRKPQVYYLKGREGTRFPEGRREQLQQENCSFPGVSGLGSSSSEIHWCPKYQSPASPLETWCPDQR